MHFFRGSRKNAQLFRELATSFAGLRLLLRNLAKECVLPRMSAKECISAKQSKNDVLAERSVESLFWREPSGEIG